MTEGREELKLSDLVVDNDEKENVLSELHVNGFLPVEWDVSNNISSYPQRTFKCDEIIEKLLATSRIRQEDSHTPISELEYTKKFHEYCEKGKELLRELSVEGERDETKIVVLKEFFDIPECIWRLL